MAGRVARDGGCQCGGVRYQLAADLRAIYVCHCRECRKQSASAFGISVIAPSATLRVTRGVPKLWSRATDSGGTLECAFCPECGTRLWHQRQDARETISVKGGSLDEGVDLSSAIHIWTSRMLPGVCLPEGSKQFSGEPES